jgi:hypothetical protein
MQETPSLLRAPKTQRARVSCGKPSLSSHQRVPAAITDTWDAWTSFQSF